MIGRTKPRPALPPEVRTQVADLRATVFTVLDMAISRAQYAQDVGGVDLLLDVRSAMERAMSGAGDRG